MIKSAAIALLVLTASFVSGYLFSQTYIDAPDIEVTYNNPNHCPEGRAPAASDSSHFPTHAEILPTPDFYQLPTPLQPNNKGNKANLSQI